tara:strand:+ start:717 stop:917 length:201 start_codon:yes stop_codon:yes gene_type:complete
MNELRNAINEHIVSEKMKDVLILMLRRIEEMEGEIAALYHSEVSQHDLHQLKNKVADLFEIPRSDL